jgi:hypothetical protein
LDLSFVRDGRPDVYELGGRSEADAMVTLRSVHSLVDTERQTIDESAAGLPAHPLEPLSIDVCGASAFFCDAAKLFP